MRSWRAPVVPRLSDSGPVPRVFDTARGEVVATAVTSVAGLYVCGITPYDATHIGHAATYLAFDTLNRLWRDAGLEVRYVQNTTDVDDPLLERAARDGVDWRDLAAQQTELFRTDMEALGIVPPEHYIAVTEVIKPVADAVDSLLERDIAYPVGEDLYFDSAAAEAVSPWQLGDESHESRASMLTLSAERGGDPERPGKRDALDPLLWRGAREGEPSWPTVLGEGRPGWHIECSVIAATYLDLPMTVKGGGRDLIFPHHEFSAGHTAALSGQPLADVYAHTGLVAYQGEKMSKSLGNLVFVSQLVRDGVDPRAIRLAVLAHRYRDDWEWTDAVLATAQARLTRWGAWAASAVESTEGVEAVRAILANDLDTPGALRFIDDAAPTTGLVTAVDALLGVRL
jgi:L-cysteine:1D-myo-inositol 2-amino-2-deoxy-alpha-D-glucopyranoside ligase